MENWKDLKGYEGLYQINILGDIKSLYSNKILKPKLNKGYHNVNLYKNKKSKSFNVHRLVALEFIPNPQLKKEVNHKDENKLNNKVDNLMWCTPKENSNWGTRNKRISEYLKSNPVKRNSVNGTYGHKVKKICLTTGKIIETFTSVIEAVNKNGYARSSVYACLAGKRETANGYK